MVVGSGQPAPRYLVTVFALRSTVAFILVTTPERNFSKPVMNSNLLIVPSRSGTS